MQRWSYLLLVCIGWMVWSVLLAACGTSTVVRVPDTLSEPTPTVTPDTLATPEITSSSAITTEQSIAALTAVEARITTTVTPTPTQAVPTETILLAEIPPFPSGTLIAGVPVGGLDGEEAATRLERELSTLMVPLELRVGEARLRLRPDDVGLYLPIDELLTEAHSQQRRGAAVRVPLRVRFDKALLREELLAFAKKTATSPELRFVEESEETRRGFGYVPGTSIDIDEAMEVVSDRLSAPLSARRVTLHLRTDPTMQPEPPGFDQLRAQVAALADEWNGIAGVYLQDLQSGETITVNADTVFSGASIMKVAIMLYAYTVMPDFDEEVQENINAMIIHSDNLKANDVLAATVGGEGTDAAYSGVLEMGIFMQELGFQHTYMNMPFEAYDYLVGLRGINIQRGPPQEGAPPYTAADPIVRTTPAEISRLFLMLDACSQGRGQLLDQFPNALSPQRCQAMLDLLAQNADTTRILAGIPDTTVRVEHKSGWVQDMHADAGIVRSPGGDYLLTVYLWRGVDELPDLWASPVIAEFSHLVYTAYNPQPIEAD